jgi:error-prone DNA polymerase
VPPYVELHCASAFSFLQGASLPEILIDRAVEAGHSTLALLDRDGVYGAPRFHKAAIAAGIRPITGAELTIGFKSDVGSLTSASIHHPDGSRHPAGEKKQTANFPLQTYTFLLPLLCETQAGYRNLCRLITRMKLRAPKGEGALTLEDLDGCVGGLVALVGRAALDGRRHGVGGLLDRVVGIFGRSHVFVELQRHLRRDEEQDNEALAAMAEAFRVPTLATNGVRFAAPAARPLYDVLTCIHHHTTLMQAGRRLAPNAERYLKPPDEMAALFGDHAGAVARTRELADRLQYTMADLGYRFPDYPVPPGETQMSFLRKITDVGARERYRPYHDRARAQVARELDLIEKLQLAGYFLIVWDIVNFCRQHDVLVQGRGSAANSAVCYSLGITAVDPVGMDLLFERFLSEERGEWPDIDLDLPSGDRRETVIQHVYEKYGKLGAAMTANVITYRGRSAAREVGKALGFDPAQIDRLAKVLHHFEYVDTNDSFVRQLSSVGLDLNTDYVRHFARLWHEMQDLPRHLGQHSGGMVICQGQLDAVVPLENASMPGRVVVQWDKDDCADMGIVKVDLLGLGMMAVLQDSLALINGEKKNAELAENTENTIHSAGSAFQRPAVDLAHLPQDDPAVYEMLQKADTIGVFQVESRAQMATLPRLKPSTFYDLVVEVAIIRPGPIVGQMVHPYLNRRAGNEPVQYPHPSLEPILKRTLGVPLFQEQLLRMAMVAAGFTGGQAEDLRRAMGFKRSEKRMKQIEVQLREGMAHNGITGEAAETIITSIASFALYGFPESHAASFALLAYASAYLKMYYPAAFYTSLLNNQPMGFYHPSTLVKDAQRRGVRFHPIDIQVSNWECTVEADGGIRLGLRYVSGLRQEAGRAIATAAPGTSTQHLAPGTQHSLCPKCGCDDQSMLEHVAGDKWFCNNCSHDWTRRHRPARFKSLDDLVKRAGLRRDEVVTLADLGALNAFGYDRRSALWQAERAVRPSGALFNEEWNAGHTGIWDAEDGWKLNAERAEHAENLYKPTSPVSSEFSVVKPSEPSVVNPSMVSEPSVVNPLVFSEPSVVNPSVFSEPSVVNPSVFSEPSVVDPSVVCPLKPMTEAERLVADYAGMGLTIGRHPMALRRDDLSMRGILRACDLATVRQGRRVRVAGMVITRQRPGTAKGFVFLTLEDETGIANIIVRPDLFASERLTVIEEPFLIVDGVLQNQEGVTSIRAERMEGMRGVDIDFDAHDFY